MSEINIYHYLLLGLIIFLIGLIGTIISRHVLKVLISIEIMLTGININFIAFATYSDGINFDGYTMALFYVAIGAVELAVALFIFYLMYKKKNSEIISEYGDL